MITLNDVRITSTIHILYLINLYNYIIFIYYNDIHDNLYKRQISLYNYYIYLL